MQGKRYLHPQQGGSYRQPMETRIAFEAGLFVPARSTDTRAGVRVASYGRAFNPVVGRAGVIVDVRPQGGKQGISIADLREVHFPEVHIEGFGGA